MDVQTLRELGSWEWPRSAWKLLQGILVDRHANEADRLIAAELAGDLVVMNDALAGNLLAIIRSADEPEQLRAQAAISLGPVLEDTDTNGYEDPEAINISRSTFRDIRDSLHRLYLDDSIPKEVRRRILEASVRAHEDWHRDAITTAYSSGERDWILTAVFAMQWVRGFDKQILDALNNTDPEIHCEAVEAAGNWELDAAWSHIVLLVDNARTPKPLLLAAIGAVAKIRPQQARTILSKLAEPQDEEIAEAANDAIMLAEIPTDDDEEDESERDI
jgi:hypothetical protein